MWPYGKGPLKASHQLAKLGDYGHCGDGDIMVLALWY